METWSTHHLFRKAKEKHDHELALSLQKYANQLRIKGLPVIYSLGHLAKITSIDYKSLHDTVNRKREKINYSLFAIKKRDGRKRRFIHAVNGRLLNLHRFINEEILQKTSPHPCSYAFHKSGGIKKCAQQHCGSQWILQFDLADFFYSISELNIYKAFMSMGYKRLVAFELARLCTTLHLPEAKKIALKRNTCASFFMPSDKPYTPSEFLGVLPQGAPCSPMLSNIVAYNLDCALQEYADNFGFVYTRYADDIAFSSSQLPKSKSIREVQNDIIYIIRKSGFRENVNKMRVAGPGSRKVILGLLVNGDSPKLSKNMRGRIDRYIYLIDKFGIEKAREICSFESSYGFYNHVSGYLSFIKDIDPKIWESLKSRFRSATKEFNH